MATSKTDLTTTWESLGTGGCIVQIPDARNAIVYVGTTPAADAPGISVAAAGGTLNLSWVTAEVWARSVKDTATVIRVGN